MMDRLEVDVEQIELDLVLEAIFRRWGYDFRDYARGSLRRRLSFVLAQSRLGSLAEMLPKILHDRGFFDLLLDDLSVGVTAMFRDPQFFAALRESVFPVLQSYPFIKIWHAGCATGEEVYSMAILLQEEGLYSRCLIYATDYNHRALEAAREGRYSLHDMRTFTANYLAAGGRASFSDYYLAEHGSAKMAEALREKITFASHNLAVDGVFGEMHLIVCRNVLIYFNRALQNRVLTLFRNSLCRRGHLCLGSKETLEFSGIQGQFQAVSARERIFRLLDAIPAGSEA